MPRRRKPDDPFRWFDSSPEVIRLTVIMYVRYPLSLRNVEDLLHERGIDILPRYGEALVDPVGPHVRRRDPQEAGRSNAQAHPLALAPGRGLRPHERRDALPLEGGRP